MMLFTCLLLIKIRLWKLFTVFKWCKTCAHWIKEQKKFCWKKIFIEISDSNLTFPTESIWEKFTACQLWVSKKIFWDLNSKIRFHSFVGLDLEHRLSTHNMVISLELKAIKTQKWKKSKSLTWVHFWNNRLQVLPKFRDSRSVRSKYRKNGSKRQQLTKK